MAWHPRALPGMGARSVEKYMAAISSQGRFHCGGTCEDEEGDSYGSSRLRNFANRSGEFCVGKLIVSTNAGRNWCHPQIVNQQTCHQPLQA